MINESGVSFYPGGGHNHDGENSTLINTSVYSVYDFPVQIIGDPNRTADQIRNLDSFKQLIIDTVNQSIIAPSGIVFQQGIVNGSAHIISRSISTETIAADAITANEIAAGTITADLLAANFVLVNNIIRSNNFDGNVAANGSITSAGTAGWAIAGDGTAVFDSSYIRGSIIANSVSTPGIDILSNGAIQSTNFNVDPSGNITATGASISGTVTASQIEASTFFIDSLNYWTSDGQFNVGTDGNFLSFDGTDLLLSGAVNATSGNIGGWVINGNVLQSSNAATILNPNGDIDLAGQLDATGNINTGADMNISGSVTANTSVNILGNQGVYYPTVAGSVGVASKGISFYWNGTNVYARLYNSSNGTYQDVCLTNCGTGTTSASTAATTTAAPGTTTTTTAAPATTTTTLGPPPTQGSTTSTAATTTTTTECPAGCTPPCPQDFICFCGICIG